MKRIYIAGRITGKGYPGVRKQFAAAKQFLLHQGFDEVVSPVEIVPPGTGWTESMMILLPYLAACNYMALLPGYEPSKGAMCEYYFARGMENEGKLHAIIHIQVEKPQANTKSLTNIETSGTLKQAI